ncbi:unnamed protein product, partial [Notodromas monacha]
MHFLEGLLQLAFVVGNDEFLIIYAFVGAVEVFFGCIELGLARDVGCKQGLLVGAKEFLKLFAVSVEARHGFEFSKGFLILAFESAELGFNITRERICTSWLDPETKMIPQWSLIKIVVISTVVSMPWADANRFRINKAKSKENGHPSLLYPKDTATRELKRLDGVWDFRLAPFNNSEIGFTQQWFSQPLRNTGTVLDMPVPSSFNDITQDRKIRDHVGWVWYETNFIPPQSWATDSRIVLRFGSVQYLAVVYLNGNLITTHVGGHLPFESDVTTSLNFGSKNRITVAVNNTLDHNTVPQADIYQRPGAEYAVQDLFFDFFNYAGIHRSVILYRTPQTYINDVTFVTLEVNEEQSNAQVSVSVDIRPATTGGLECLLVLEDHTGSIAHSTSIDLDAANSVSFPLTNARFWWPYLMRTDYGYLYQLKLNLQRKSDGLLLDSYDLPVGIRTVSWNSDQFFINNSPFYFRGFGKHEDYPIRGKGLDWPYIIKDFNLLHWVGANSFRTSHYPYSEEIVQTADKYGIVIIDEVPAVALRYFHASVLDVHKQMVAELIQRDKNNPSVVMWSLGNECKTAINESQPYF